MSSRVIVVDDKTGAEIVPGTVYFAVEITTQTATEYNIGAIKKTFLDGVNWESVIELMTNGLPENATELRIVKRTA